MRGGLIIVGVFTLGVVFISLMVYNPREFPVLTCGVYPHCVE